jgi:hypothetical protein
VTTAARYLSPVSFLTALLVASLVAVPPALAQPSGSAFVYWPNTQSGTIGRGTVDGNPANVNQSFIKVGNEALAVINVGSIASTCTGPGSPGSGARTSTAATRTRASSPSGGGTGEVVLTVDGQHIYWSIPMPQPRSSC